MRKQEYGQSWSVQAEARIRGQVIWSKLSTHSLKSASIRTLGGLSNTDGANVSDLAGLGWGLTMYSLKKMWQMLLLLPVAWRPEFENHSCPPRLFPHPTEIQSTSEQRKSPWHGVALLIPVSHGQPVPIKEPAAHPTSQLPFFSWYNSKETTDHWSETRK